MIPTAFDRYWQDVNRAEAMARRGHFVAGYDCLQDGLHAAEAALAEGHVWAPALLGRYRQALTDYIEAHGVQAPAACEGEERDRSTGP